MADRRQKRKRRERNGLIEFANALLGLVVLAMLAAGGVIFYGVQKFYADDGPPAATTFVVERNSSLSTVAGRLEEAELIDNRYIFMGGTYLQKKQGEIKAGEFNIPAKASMSAILHELTEGKAIQYSVTIPEGYTAWQVIDRLNDQDILTGEIATLPKEGTVMPQTYNFDRGATRVSVLEHMQKDMAEQVTAIFASCDSAVCGPNGPIHNAAELVTLASVVEKETGIATERPQVAAVFLNRLRKGMRLQSDPTIIYGITKGTSVLGRDLKKSEIEAHNDYNTYQMDGLPKGPIANPGIDALKAVAHPAPTQDLYFVAAGADPSQGHLFAPTYKQHQLNVVKYRQALRQAQRDGEAEAAKEALEAEQAKAGGDETTSN